MEKAARLIHPFQLSCDDSLRFLTEIKRGDRPRGPARQKKLVRSIRLVSRVSIGGVSSPQSSTHFFNPVVIVQYSIFEFVVNWVSSIFKVVLIFSVSKFLSISFCLVLSSGTENGPSPSLSRKLKRYLFRVVADTQAHFSSSHPPSRIIRTMLSDSFFSFMFYSLYQFHFLPVYMTTSSKISVMESHKTLERL